ncbi:BCS1 N terminal-domain-containing protein [Xylariaceae sp. FL0594]|nr:BCS1 N terminal-domain-containing protein [Xylariaceae sp. FL0594]
MAHPLQPFLSGTGYAGAGSGADTPASPSPSLAILDWLLPGFSSISDVVQAYSNVNLDFSLHILLPLATLVVWWRYVSGYMSRLAIEYFMSTVDIPNDDDVFTIFYNWLAFMKWARETRRSVVNAQFSSRYWRMWTRSGDDDADDEDKKRKPLHYTPSMGTHPFWYKCQLFFLRRSLDESAPLQFADREKITLMCFGWNSGILKELLAEALQMYLERDDHKTKIYRGIPKTKRLDSRWQRCTSRASRPFSRILLNEKTKQELLADVSDYLSPATRRWYANRGIPYRRGYLFYGPPGTGKSSLSLALAGHWKLPIYIVTLSLDITDEDLAELFSKLPHWCVVLIEDIDTAGLTHAREKASNSPSILAEGGRGTGNNRSGPVAPTSRLSLAGLLNILDGVASQEGRVLIMTTNHVEKLDKALRRPGRVDMMVKFAPADRPMTACIFKNIFARLEGDESPPSPSPPSTSSSASVQANRFYLSRFLGSLFRPFFSGPKKPEAVRTSVSECRQAAEDKAQIPEHEFSPAELQGHLLKHKHSRQKAIDTAEEFVANTRKARKHKELKAAEEKRQTEKTKKEEEEKKGNEGKEKEIKKAVEEKVLDTVKEEVEAKVSTEMRNKKRDDENEKAGESDDSHESGKESLAATSANSTTRTPPGDPALGADAETSAGLKAKRTAIKDKDEDKDTSGKTWATSRFLKQVGHVGY